MLSKIDYVNSFYKNLSMSQDRTQPYNLYTSIKTCILCRIMNILDMLLVLLWLESTQFNMRSIVRSCMLCNLMRICGTCCQWSPNSNRLGSLYIRYYWGII